MNAGDEIKFTKGPFKGLLATVADYNAESKMVVLRFYRDKKIPVSFEMLNEMHQWTDKWSVP
jgi:transcription antitermination factor NusG